MEISTPTEFKFLLCLLWFLSDRKPNPNWLLTKGHLLVYRGAEMVSGMADFKVQMMISGLSSLSSAFCSVTLRLRFKEWPRWLAAVLEPCFSLLCASSSAVFVFQVQETSVRTSFSEVLLYSRCSHWVRYPFLKWSLWPAAFEVWIGWGPGDLSYLRPWGAALAAAHNMGVNGWWLSLEKLTFH